MQRIAQQIREMFREMDGQGEPNSWYYQTELNIASIEAASLVVHSTEDLGFLLDDGANVNVEANSCNVVLALFKAPNKGRPRHFGPKVEYLLHGKVGLSRVRSSEGDQTTL